MLTPPDALEVSGEGPRNTVEIVAWTKLYRRASGQGPRNDDGDAATSLAEIDRRLEEDADGGPLPDEDPERLSAWWTSSSP